MAPNDGSTLASDQIPSAQQDMAVSKDGRLRGDSAKSQSNGKATPAQRTVLLTVSAALAGLLLGAILMHVHDKRHSVTVVKVNGAPISSDQLNQALWQAAGPQVLHGLIQDQLQLQFAASQNLLPTQSQIDDRYDKDSASPGFIDRLAANQMSVDDYKAKIQLQLAEQAVFTRGVTLSDADMRDFYKKQSDPTTPHALFYRPETINLKAICTNDLQSAQKARAELVNIPIDLVARRYSVDPSKDNGAVVPPLVLGHSPLTRFPAVEKQVFAMEPGDQTDPIPIGRQWWIFQCVSKNPANTIPYNDVIGQVRTDALVAKGASVNGSAVKQAFEQFAAGSKVVYSSAFAPAGSNTAN